jgi:hypothetical protein
MTQENVSGWRWGISSKRSDSLNVFSCKRRIEFTNT